MKLNTMLGLSALALVGVASSARAQSTDSHSVAIEVQAINQLVLTGSPTLTISTATAGSAPTSASSSNISYAITTNESDRKITAQLDSDVPAGLTLSANLAAPAGATSAGSVVLSSTAQDVVTAISTVNASGLDLTYTLGATSAAGVVSTSRTVTYTIIAE